MCMIDDAKPATFVFQQIPQAQKPHICSECNRTIQPGEKYTRTSVGFDDTVKTYKMCRQCKDAASWLEYHCGGWCYGSISEELGEHYDEGYREDSLQKILIGIRRQWRAFQGTGLLEVPLVSSLQHPISTQPLPLVAPSPTPSENWAGHLP